MLTYAQFEYVQYLRRWLEDMQMNSHHEFLRTEDEPTEVRQLKENIHNLQQKLNDLEQSKGVQTQNSRDKIRLLFDQSQFIYDQYLSMSQLQQGLFDDSPST